MSDINDFDVDALTKRMNEPTPADVITAKLHEMGFEFSHHFVRDDFDGREGSSHWSVTIGRNGRPGREVTMNYSMGAAHRHYVKMSGRPGKPITLPYGNMSVHQFELNKKSKPNKPDMMDVFHSFMLDASCADCANYAEFADNLGYDRDSISGDKIYRACQDQLAAYNGLTDYKEQEGLQELFQDY